MAPGVAPADEDTADHAAVDGEAALPDREDLRRLARIVVEVEEHVVEPRADETAEERELGGLEERLGIEPAPLRVAVREPEPEGHRRRHQEPVPAKREGTEGHEDRAG